MSFILLVEQEAPETPSANQVVIYPKADGLMYSKDDTGTESVIATGSATQAQQEQGTSTSVFTSPGTQHLHPSSGKVWLQFQIDGSVDASYNVDSVTDTAAGNWTVNLTSSFSVSTYGAGANCSPVSASALNSSIGVRAKTVSTFQIVLEQSDGGQRDPEEGNVDAWAFGDQ